MSAKPINFYDKYATYTVYTLTEHGTTLKSRSAQRTQLMTRMDRKWHDHLMTLTAASGLQYGGHQLTHAGMSRGGSGMQLLGVI